MIAHFHQAPQFKRHISLNDLIIMADDEGQPIAASCWQGSSDLILDQDRCLKGLEHRLNTEGSLRRNGLDDNIERFILSLCPLNLSHAEVS